MAEKVGGLLGTAQRIARKDPGRRMQRCPWCEVSPVLSKFVFTGFNPFYMVQYNIDSNIQYFYFLGPASISPQTVL